MIWHSNTVNVDIETGEILTNLKNYIKIKRDERTRFPEFNHAVRDITNYYKRNPQLKLVFGDETGDEGFDDLPF